MGKVKRGDAVDEPFGGMVAVAVASYNHEISKALESGFFKEIGRMLVDGSQVASVRVPGSLELAYGLRHLAENHPPGQRPDVLVALGCVLRGETYHFEVVSMQSAAAIGRVGENTGLPVVNGILTCDTLEQATHRARAKPREFALAACALGRLSRSGYVRGIE